MTNDEVQKMIELQGGQVKEFGPVLPDGSSFAVASFPLPKDHWLTQQGNNIPPRPFRMGISEKAIINMRMQDACLELTRSDFADKIREAGRYAIRASTLNGVDMDFDPDAMLQNLVVAFLGEWTENGLSGENWEDSPQG